MFSYLTKVKNKTISFFHVRTFASLQLVVLALLSLVVFNPSPLSARADAQAPYSTITVGDWWSYSTTNYASGLTLTGSMTETINRFIQAGGDWNRDNKRVGSHRHVH
ncbi:MAG: hypothetical protein AUI95_00060 [Crenarchaeota archaeon 13_1_40CM_3_52_4]|nr:MAG: hypothetical protein AUI95_00060 [Crenarchaeota archaeon 13_1_40CM_3_52_4]